MAVGLNDVIWPQDSETRGSDVAQRKLPSTESYSLNASQVSGWPARRWGSKPRPQEAPPSILFSWETIGMYGYTGEARDRSLGSTTKIRLPERKGDDSELTKDVIEDLSLR